MIGSVSQSPFLVLPLVANLRFGVAEGFSNPFFAVADDTASLHRVGQTSRWRYPLGPTGAICRTRSHVAKKSFSQ